MKSRHASCSRALLMAIAALGLASCEGSGDNMDVHGSVSVGMYYGTSYYNPWMYGPGYPPPVVVVPPGGGIPPGSTRPPGGGGGGAVAPRPTPLPARPSPSMGGGGRRR